MPALPNEIHLNIRDKAIPLLRSGTVTKFIYVQRSSPTHNRPLDFTDLKFINSKSIIQSVTSPQAD